MTNAEKIRSLTDEDLALFLDNFIHVYKEGQYCFMLGKNGDEHKGCFDSEYSYDCVKCLAEWIRKGAENDE